MNTKSSYSIARNGSKVPRQPDNIPTLTAGIDLSGGEHIRTHAYEGGPQMSLERIEGSGGHQSRLTIHGNFSQLKYVCKEWLRQLEDLEREIAEMPENCLGDEEPCDIASGVVQVEA